MNLAQAACNEANHLLDSAMIKINHCLEQLSDDQVWWRPSDEANSIGNLLLHISGNLRQWGIVPLRGEKDLRERQEEFDFRGPMDRDELMSLVNRTVSEAKDEFAQLDESRLLTEAVIQGFPVTLYKAMMHTTTHFIGHAHQIILLTRIQLGREYKFQWSPEAERGKLPM